MVTHSSILARITSWTEEPGGLQSTGLKRVGRNWATEHTHKVGKTHKQIIMIYRAKCSNQGRMPWGLLPAQEEVHPPSCGEAGGYQERLSGEGDTWGPGGWGPSHEKGQDEQVREVTNSRMSGEFYLQLISLEWKVRSSVWEGLGWRHLKTGLGFMLAPKRGSWNVHWMFSKSWHDEIMFLNITWKSSTYLILSAFVGFLFVWFFLTERHVGSYFLNQGSNLKLPSNLLKKA